MKFHDRYAWAVDEGIQRDVVGAAGLACVSNETTGRRGEPLAMALMRLFVGDDSEARAIVDTLAEMLCNRAERLDLKPRMKHTKAVDIARAVLAWHRDGRCRACGGHGFLKVEGAPALSGHACPKCRVGKIPFEREFQPEYLSLAEWLLVEIERECSRAGPAAMAVLAPRLDL